MDKRVVEVNYRKHCELVVQVRLFTHMFADNC